MQTNSWTNKAKKFEWRHWESDCSHRIIGNIWRCTFIDGIGDLTHEASKKTVDHKSWSILTDDHGLLKVFTDIHRCSSSGVICL